MLPRNRWYLLVLGKNFYRLNSKGYIVSSIEGKRILAHTYINHYYNGPSPAILPPGNKFWVTHHKDHKKYNNHPDNLCWMGDNDHRIFHINQWTPEFRNKMSKIAKNTMNLFWMDKEFVRRHKIRTEITWKNEEYVEKMKISNTRNGKNMLRNKINKVFNNIRLQGLEITLESYTNFISNLKRYPSWEIAKNYINASVHSN